MRDTPGDPEDSAIAVAVIALAHGLNLRVVAEGVGNLEQAAFLREQGCDDMQGYLLSKPMLAADVPDFLDRQASRLQPELTAAC